MRKLIIILSILMAMGSLNAQDASGISAALGKGDHASLASMMASTVDLTIGKREGTYSRNQAEIMLRDFFEANPPKGHQHKHEGKSGAGGHFLIGELQLESVRMDSYVILAKQGERFRIQEIRLEDF